jgi:hypothetical protein
VLARICVTYHTPPPTTMSKRRTIRTVFTPEEFIDYRKSETLLMPERYRARHKYAM